MSVRMMAFAQDPLNEKSLEQAIENRESEPDYIDIEERLEYLVSHPVNLNNATPLEIANIPGLNTLLADALIQHRKAYGELTSVYELQVIEGFDPELIRDIHKYICVREILKFNLSSFPEANYHHEWIFSISRRLEKSLGYRLPGTDKNAFNGSPYKHSSRYRGNIGKFNLGFSTEKDAGEHWRDQFLTFYVQFLWTGRIKQFILGDFQADFGQGLCFGSGMGTGKSSAVMNIMKRPDMIKPGKSLNENALMRGFAIKGNLARNIHMTAFYSFNPVDGNIEQDSTGSGYTGFPTGGKYRNSGEGEKRNAIKRTVLGTNMHIDFGFLQIGCTAIRTLYGMPSLKQTKPYRLFDAREKDIRNYGVNYKLFYRNFLFFGESAINTGYSSLSHIHGLLASLDKKFDLSMLFRHYSPSYTAVSANAFGEASRNCNETGFYMGCVLTLGRSFKLSAYADVFHFKWLKYQVNSPSYGQDMFMELQYNKRKTYSWYIRYSHGIKEANEKGIHISKRLESLQKKQLRGHMECIVSPDLILKNRFEYVWHKGTLSSTSSGLLMYQDIQFRFRKKVRLILRYAVFDVETYDSRIYAYENDMTYSFSVPLFQDKGSRTYLLVKYKMNKNLHICFRFARTSYENADITGSGVDRIDSNRITDTGIQFIWKL